MDIRLALMTGVDIPIPELQATLHQPTIKEISFIGEPDFLAGVQCLSVRKEMLTQDESLLSTTSNFQIFMTIMNDKSVKETVEKKQQVLAVLNLLFPNYQIFFTPRAISMNCERGNVIIDEGNFEKFQEVIGQVFCLQKSDGGSFNPTDAKAKEIADKLMKARQRVAAQKKAEQGDGSVLAQYVSTLTVGISSMSMEDCINLTMYQMYDLVERYSLYISWDIDLKSRLAGAKPDKPVDNWMKQIH